jgi:hypothetical protein
MNRNIRLLVPAGQNVYSPSGSILQSSAVGAKPLRAYSDFNKKQPAESINISCLRHQETKIPANGRCSNHRQARRHDFA